MSYRYLDNGILELDNNTVERAVKSVPLGHKNWFSALRNVVQPQLMAYKAISAGNYS